MTYLFFLFMLVIAVLWHSCFPAVAAENCPVVPKADISALFQQWNQSLQTRQPAEVANHYADDAILIPTISSGVRHNLGEIEDYFQKFLAFHPDGRIEEENIQVYCDIAVNSGIYTFTLIKKGLPTEMRARFTFVYHKVGDRWLIVDHHSSAMPENSP